MDAEGNMRKIYHESRDNVKILFYADIMGNCGPGNINKGIIDNLSESMTYVRLRGKVWMLLDALKTLVRSDAVVVSGVGRTNNILVRTARMLGKPSAYLMHGCAEFEYEINHMKPDPKGLTWERSIMKHASLLLPVSKRFMYWVRQHYPQYADKTGFIYNGVDEKIFAIAGQSIPKTRDIAVAGGLRPQKMNRVVEKAVEAMDGDIYLDVYGGPVRVRNAGRKTRHNGKLSNEAFLSCLSETRLFVLNSVLETFGIAAMEALACGCSLLVSDAAGVADLLALEETDVIHDPANVEELRGKMEYLLAHPNHDRLMSRFDAEQWTFRRMAERLEKICEILVNDRQNVLSYFDKAVN